MHTSVKALRKIEIAIGSSVYFLNLKELTSTPEQMCVLTGTHKKRMTLEDCSILSFLYTINIFISINTVILVFLFTFKILP